MASLHSGSREDVELVLVETDDISLIIKGKPYHERYEGLKQFRSMDFHDVMKFSVKGERINAIRVYDITQQQLLGPTELRPIFLKMEFTSLLLYQSRTMN